MYSQCEGITVMTNQTPGISLTPEQIQAENHTHNALLPGRESEGRPAESGAVNPLGYIAISNLGKQLMARVFAVAFYGLSVMLVASGMFEFFSDIIAAERELMSITVNVVNSLIIGLAMFELGAGISKEYTESDEEGNVFTNIRRTITRFVGTVCIALVLEALIMIIKYSQLDLAGNLFYPVAILVGASVLLISLGGFLALTRGHTQ
jgi:hypothetical protein